MKRLLLFLVVLGLIIAFSPAAYSGEWQDNGSKSLMIKAHVSPTCAVWTNDLVFPVYIGDEIPLRNWHGASVDVKCTLGTDYKIKMSRGLRPHNNWDANGIRRMESQKEANNFLRYIIKYWDEDSGSYELWKDFNGEFPRYVSDGNRHSEKIFGMVPAQGTDKPSGAYVDVVDITVRYFVQ